LFKGRIFIINERTTAAVHRSLFTLDVSTVFAVIIRRETEKVSVYSIVLVLVSSV
jgi:hypothetical protein